MNPDLDLRCRATLRGLEQRLAHITRPLIVERVEQRTGGLESLREHGHELEVRARADGTPLLGKLDGRARIEIEGVSIRTRRGPTPQLHVTPAANVPIAAYAAAVDAASGLARRC